MSLGCQPQAVEQLAEVGALGGDDAAGAVVLTLRHRGAVGEERLRRENEATLDIRRAMAREGSFLVNYAQLDGAETFRAVASNLETTSDDLAAMLDRIEAE